MNVRTRLRSPFHSERGVQNRISLRVDRCCVVARSAPHTLPTGNKGAPPWRAPPRLCPRRPLRPRVPPEGGLRRHDRGRGDRGWGGARRARGGGACWRRLPRAAAG